jgi:hypothetical protein
MPACVPQGPWQKCQNRHKWRLLFRKLLKLHNLYFETAIDSGFVSLPRAAQSLLAAIAHEADSTRIALFVMSR